MIARIKRNSTIYVGDYIVRKTDSTLNKDEDIVVCFPGARIERVTEEYTGSWDVEMDRPYWFTSRRKTQTRKEQQR